MKVIDPLLHCLNSGKVYEMGTHCSGFEHLHQRWFNYYPGYYDYLFDTIQHEFTVTVDPPTATCRIDDLGVYYALEGADCNHYDCCETRISHDGKRAILMNKDHPHVQEQPICFDDLSTLYDSISGGFFTDGARPYTDAECAANEQCPNYDFMIADPYNPVDRFGDSFVGEYLIRGDSGDGSGSSSWVFELGSSHNNGNANFFRSCDDGHGDHMTYMNLSMMYKVRCDVDVNSVSVDYNRVGVVDRLKDSDPEWIRRQWKKHADVMGCKDFLYPEGDPGFGYIDSEKWENYVSVP